MAPSGGQGKVGELTKRSKVIAWASLAVVATMLLGACPLVGADDDEPRPVIVVFKDKVDKKLITDAGGEIDIEFSTLPAVATELKPKAIDELKKSSKVKRIEDDSTVYALGEDEGKGGGGGKPPPQGQTMPWGITQINADDAWADTKGTAVKVAIVDTGIDKDHPDLEANIKGGANFVPSRRGTVDSTKWDDDHGHGTHCAGIVAAIDNTIGVIGVAPEVNLYGVKVLDSGGRGQVTWLYAGIEWCIANDIDVISMSIGGWPWSQTMEDTFDAAYEAGIVMVAAAGNSGGTSGGDTVIYPAKLDCVIAVAATDSSNVRAYFSSVGPDLELSAPGVSVYSTYYRGKYTTMSGTSMACPHVAGTIALLLIMTPSYYDEGWGLTWEPNEVRARLQGTTFDLGADGWDDLYGHGLVDALAAITV